MSGACCHLFRLREANTQCRQVRSAWCHLSGLREGKSLCEDVQKQASALHAMVDEAVIHTVGSDRKTKAHVTLTINGNSDVSFHMDTGSSVDILPYDDYVRATDDNQCEKLENTNIRLVMHNKSHGKPMVLAHLQVHRKDAQRPMRFVVVRYKVVPLLSLQSCLDLDLIKINDCDAINAVVMQTNEHNRDICNGGKHTKKETTMPQRETAHAKPTRPKPEVTRPKQEVTSKPKVLQDPVFRE